LCCINYFIIEPVSLGFVSAMGKFLPFLVSLGVVCKGITDVSVKSVHSVFVDEEKAACVKRIGCREKAEQSWDSDKR
jgi:hypothetical protein